MSNPLNRKMKNGASLFIVANLLLLAGLSCTRHDGDPGAENPADSVLNSSGIRYAKGFTIEQFDDYKRITVHNPWQGAQDIVIQYYLVSEGKVPEGVPENARVIKTPVRRIICMSTTHIGMLDFIDKLETLVGISGKMYINNPWVKDQLARDRITDIGYEQNIQYEELITLKPDLVMTYGIGSEVAGYVNKLQEVGIPVIINGDYIEQTPLAKAEWVKVVAALYEMDDAVNKKFERVVEEYRKVKMLATDVTARPKVMIGLPWKDTWYIPGGNSFAANFIRDAGGSYIWEDKHSVEAIPFNIEAVYEAAKDADIWINPGIAASLEDIVSVDERLVNFKPVRVGSVYNNNRILNEQGGNDYWESGIMNPQKILMDLIKIFHPGLLPDHQLVYYQKIEADDQLIQLY